MHLIYLEDANISFSAEHVLYFSILGFQCLKIKIKKIIYKYQRIPSLTQSLLANVPFYEIGSFVMWESRIN